MTPNISLATLADAKAIATLHIQSWQSAHAGIYPTAHLAKADPVARLRFWQNLLIDPDAARHVLVSKRVAKQLDGLTGFLSHGLARDPQFQDWREIHDFYIDPDQQGQGIGTALLNQALTHIQNRGDMGAYIWVVAANPARYFFETKGAVLINERVEHTANQQHRMLAYAWQFS